MENSDLMSNICHKKKWDDIDNGGGRKQVGVDSRGGRGWRQEPTTSGGGEDGVGSRAGEEKERTVVVIVVGIIPVSVWKTILNFLIIVISGN